MKYAEIAVDSGISTNRTFSYSIPTNMIVEEGQLVWVPFGSHITQGLVIKLTEHPQVEATRDILQAIEPSPLLSNNSLRDQLNLPFHQLPNLPWFGFPLQRLYR